ncbi:hypothetical protein H696_02412 [Fonticula alba]|uniref:Calcium uniporter protein C-terminal domain-containing protein n=1 Tax=Fonticula alba TaxID=691883 RepID=A0A058ZC09_FONAL|nr:hypothetical protein H696_02412 [Fonticula alba]KCV71466.1 hypothetical protein H696_02412 [Fonticula alba]|eukprot:XP_009494589.1 hypothetical protein H696_02412 [Fonticula alba]
MTRATGPPRCFPFHCLRLSRSPSPPFPNMLSAAFLSRRLFSSTAKTAVSAAASAAVPAAKAVATPNILNTTVEFACNEAQIPDYSRLDKAPLQDPRVGSVVGTLFSSRGRITVPRQFVGGAAAAAVDNNTKDRNLHIHIDVHRPVDSLLAALEAENQRVTLGAFDAHGNRISRASVLADVLGPGTDGAVTIRPLTDKPDAPELHLNLPTLAHRTRDAEKLLAELIAERAPLLEIKDLCDQRAQKFSDRLVKAGLAFIVVQWGAMMRLTWWDLSWDVMEPIAYFLTFGTGIMGYIFYLGSRKDYTYEALHHVSTSSRKAKLYNKAGLDTERLVAIESDINVIKRSMDHVKLEYLTSRWK